MDTLSTSPYILLPIPIIGILILAFYLLRKNKAVQPHGNGQKDPTLNTNKSELNGSGVVNSEISHHGQHHQQSTKSKSTKSRNTKRGSEKNSTHHSHPWLASNLKGHTDDINDIDFSNNGKFLASCAEDNNNSNRSHRHHHRIIRNDHRKTSTSTDSTGSGDDINSSSSNEDISIPYTSSKQNKKTTKTGRNRRQRKNHTKQTDLDEDIRENNSEQSKSLLRNKTKITSQQQHQQQQQQSSSSATSLKTTTITKQSLYNQQHIQQEKTGDHLMKISRIVIPPLRQHIKLNLHESELVKFLRYYIVDPNLLRIYGYPVESASYNGSIEIFKCLPRPFTHFQTNGTINGNSGNNSSNASSRNGSPRGNIINKNDGLYTPLTYKKWLNDNNSTMQNGSSDSGQGSESSSPPSLDSDDTGEEETTTTFYTPDGSYQIFNNYNQSLEKQCVRCKKEFLVTETGEYLTNESCNYHWGKLNQIYMSNRCFGYQYSCCNGDQLSVGCSKNRLHVWTGVTVGINGPYDDFVRTTKKYHQHNNRVNQSGKVYALDCEMCFTGLGLEVTKITVVRSDGQLIYEHFVRPNCEIVDYNTRFSGITEKDIVSKSNNVKTLNQVQNDLLEFIDEDTLLIGHALDNDLKALKMIHTNVIDTSITFPHANGFPYRRALKTLTKVYLNRDIQIGENGHSSFEDSRACLELMLWRVRKDFRLMLEQ